MNKKTVTQRAEPGLCPQLDYILPTKTHHCLTRKREIFVKNTFILANDMIWLIYRECYYFQIWQSCFKITIYFLQEKLVEYLLGAASMLASRRKVHTGPVLLDVIQLCQQVNIKHTCTNRYIAKTIINITKRIESTMRDYYRRNKSRLGRPLWESDS